MPRKPKMYLAGIPAHVVNKWGQNTLFSNIDL